MTGLDTAAKSTRPFDRQQRGGTLESNLNSSGTAIPLQTGSLTAQQIAQMLIHLPIDVTFVDSDNNVRFYSESKTRIFQRTPDVIGRSVLRCHPPESVHKVKKILDDFRAGLRDSAEFWIQMKGGQAEPRFIHIRYFAMRDSGNHFQGTIEVTQDVTGIRNLQGERRLLAEGG
jgi:DUF438 domain-containing protein